jgi:type VI secretion system protein ImpF
VIRDFEPRLTNVEVKFDSDIVDKTKASLHYRIEALLRVDPAPEPVVFDTVLELGSRAFVVRRDGV